ncbi:hypothetical protein NU10_04855 [Flavobacterium dauae]|uniref:hypothetical protein n=1 Tax=Flavobacterium dauae TaxID=1563479 RepID=UPI00101B28BF|nr:hypothetical protein [Flavobacterium dauae]WLD24718.1 hypothetical protein NU10_04855 [Flavobacterium dauae]
METDILPFRLGMQYENWEFDLEPINSRIKGYDSYIYIKEITVFDIKPRKIELIFYWELLVTIILDFNDSDLPGIQKLSMIGYKQVNLIFINQI